MTKSAEKFSRDQLAPNATSPCPLLVFFAFVAISCVAPELTVGVDRSASTDAGEPGDATPEADADAGGNTGGSTGGNAGSTGGSGGIGGMAGTGWTGGSAGVGGVGGSGNAAGSSAAGGTGPGGAGGASGAGGMGAAGIGGTAGAGGTGAGGSCLISSSGPGCADCITAHCFAECAACSADPDCLDLLDCISYCGTDPACKDDCAYYYANGVAPLLALLGTTSGCLPLRCATECPNLPSVGGGSGGTGGDPCAGATCDVPPKAYCVSATRILVYDPTGTCTGGTCSYGTHELDCDFGCSSGSAGATCKPDPCAGVTCSTPPKDYCLSANELRAFGSVGTCANGDCSYSHVDLSCTHGCVTGACRDCNVSQDCGAALWCDAGVCQPCNNDQHCGPSCLDCSSSNQLCNTAASACVQCVDDADCGLGSWCDADTCTPCDDSAHCGASCTVCTGSTPVCDGVQCVCDTVSCGAYHSCIAGACSLCAADDSCGATCSSCAVPAPRCLTSGTTSSCVECLESQDCGAGAICDATYTCKDTNCPPPPDSCSTGTQDRSGCSNARVIGRTSAAVTSGYKITDSLCSASSKFDDGTACWDAGPDHAYRIYLRKAEQINIALTTGTSCISSSWNSTLKIFSNAGCDDSSCTTKVFCDDNNTSVSKDFTADHDGWYTLTVEGSSAFDDEGSYTFTVKLTCSTPGCECP